jgi:hypothetical protein
MYKLYGTYRYIHVREQEKVFSKDEIFFINLLHLSSGCSPHRAAPSFTTPHIRNPWKPLENVSNKLET